MTDVTAPLRDLIPDDRTLETLAAVFALLQDRQPVTVEAVAAEIRRQREHAARREVRPGEDVRALSARVQASYRRTWDDAE